MAVESAPRAVVVLDRAALAGARGGLVSNFNALVPSLPQPDCGCTTPAVVVAYSGPLGVF